ncbi:MAG: hypothetical protein PHG25_01175 [Candidatus Pacebacteria bacterium]|nr:hypothetical protein [Candidatus Paceibacterota bacterium]
MKIHCTLKGLICAFTLVTTSCVAQTNQLVPNIQTEAKMLSIENKTPNCLLVGNVSISPGETVSIPMPAPIKKASGRSGVILEHKVWIKVTQAEMLGCLVATKTISAFWKTFDSSAQIVVTSKDF